MNLLPVAEAQARMLALAEPLAVECAPIGEAVGRYAAADLAARRTQPAADLSAMDGYAVRYAECPGPWTVIGESAAGKALGRALAPGEAARIFTGAAVPEGADCILIQEEAERDGDRLLMTGEGPLGVGSSVRARGSDFAEGEVLIPAGARIGPAQVALAIAGGHDEIMVRARPAIALLSTGNELVPPGQITGPDQLPASNGPMLAALLAGLPCDVVDHGIVRDDLDAIAAAFRRMAESADVIVTTGGASVGDHDLVLPALERAGAAIDFWRVAMKPGKPVMIGTLGGAIVLGLPGNPVSAFVTATLFLKPLVAHLLGAPHAIAKAQAALLGADLPSGGKRAEYLRGRWEGGLAMPLAGQDSAGLAALAASDMLIVRGIDAPAARAGDTVEILPI